MEQLLYEPVLEKLQEIHKADSLIGIPSHNNVGTIEDVIKTIASGLATYFPRTRSVIVNSDGDSKDRALQVVEADLEDPSTLLVQHTHLCDFVVILHVKGVVDQAHCPPSRMLPMCE